jgi:tetratricopeptide (TPR) repeat protein
MSGAPQFVGRSEEQERFRGLIHDSNRRDEPNEGFVILVRGHGGIGKSTLVRRFRDIARGDLAPDRANGKRLIVGLLDWEDDQRLHPEFYTSHVGPPVWWILEQLADLAIESWTASGRSKRRAEVAFDPFRRVVAQATDLAQRASDRHITHTALRPGPDDIAKVIDDATTAGVSIGAPEPVVKAVGSIAKTGVGAVGLALGLRKDRIDRDAYAELVAETDALVRAFSRGLRHLSGRKRLRGKRHAPFVLILDTCELLGASTTWLRQVMRHSGRYVYWVLGVRLEADADAAADSEAAAYQRDIHHERLRVMNLTRFDDRSLREYLRLRLDDHQVSSLDIQRVAEVTAGVPLAVSILAEMLEGGASVQHVLAPIDAEYGGAGRVVSTIARRYLVHARTIPDLRSDQPLIFGLALQHSDRKDVDLLASLWGKQVDEVASTLDGLTQRHDFVLSERRRLHNDVRDTVRRYLLDPEQRIQVQPANQRAIRYLRHELDNDLKCSTIHEQLSQDQWRTTTVALLWHTLWDDIDAGLALYAHLFPAASLSRELGYGEALADVVSFFEPVFADRHTTLASALHHLRLSGDELLTARKLAMAGFLRKASVRPNILADIPSRAAVLDLFLAAYSQQLGIAMESQVAILRRASSVIEPSTRLGERLGEVANGVSRHIRDAGSSSREIRRAVHEAARIAVTYLPAYAEAHRNLGSVLLALDDIDGAEKASRRAINLDARDAASFRQLAQVLLRSRRFTESEREFRRALRLNPNDYRSHVGLALTLRKLGRAADAELEYRSAIGLDQTSVEAHSALGEVLEELGKADAATEAYQIAAGLDSSSAYIRLRLGRLFLANGRFGNAANTFSEAAEIDPGSFEAHFGEGTAWLRLGNSEKAVHSFSRARALDPGKPEVHRGLGTSYRNLKRNEEAKAALRAAIRLSPKDFDLHLELAAVLEDLREDSVPIYEAAQRIDPTRPETYLRIGDHMRQMFQYEGAAEQYRKAIELMGHGSPEAFERLGDVLHLADRVEEGDVAFSNAKRIRARARKHIRKGERS